MEWQEVLATKTQNTEENGYGAPSEDGSSEQSNKQGKSASLHVRQTLFIYCSEPYIRNCEPIPEASCTVRYSLCLS